MKPLDELKSLETLNLGGAAQTPGGSSFSKGLASTLALPLYRGLTDLSPLAGLTSLQMLNLSDCDQLEDLSSLARLIVVAA